MTSPVDRLLELVKLARGERPYSLDCQEAETVLSIALGLAVELAVANDRIERLERHAAKGEGQSVEAWRAEALAAEDGPARAQETEAMMLRVLRVVIDPRTPVDGRA